MSHASLWQYDHRHTGGQDPDNGAVASMIHNDFGALEHLGMRCRGHHSDIVAGAPDLNACCRRLNVIAHVGGVPNGKGGPQTSKRSPSWWAWS